MPGASTSLLEALETAVKQAEDRAEETSLARINAEAEWVAATAELARLSAALDALRGAPAPLAPAAPPTTPAPPRREPVDPLEVTACPACDTVGLSRSIRLINGRPVTIIMCPACNNEMVG